MVCFYNFKFNLFDNFYLNFVNFYVQVAQWQSVRLKTSRSLVQIQSWTKVADFVSLFISIMIILKLISSVTILIEEVIFFNGMFIFLFIIFFILNFYFIFKKEKFNFNTDLIIKYYTIFFKTPNFFINFIYNMLKQIYIYFIFFKYKFKFDTLILMSKWLLINLPLTWRPLFKKFSYFGYFRSHRSKWIK